MTREPGPRRLWRVRAAALCVLAVTLTACASGGNNLQQARLAERQQDYDLAVAEYTKAARARPDDRTIRDAGNRAGFLRRVDAKADNHRQIVIAYKPGDPIVHCSHREQCPCAFFGLHTA